MLPSNKYKDDQVNNFLTTILALNKRFKYEFL